MTRALELVAHETVEALAGSVEQDGFAYMPAVLDAADVAELRSRIDVLEPDPQAFDRRSASDKHGSPTSTTEMAGKILELVRTEEYGLYHVTNEGGCSRYDYVKAIVDAFGLKTPVEPVDSSAFPRLASVPDCEILDNLNVRLVGLSPMEPWQEAIERYVRTLADAG